MQCGSPPRGRAGHLGGFLIGRRGNLEAPSRSCNGGPEVPGWGFRAEDLGVEHGVSVGRQNSTQKTVPRILYNPWEVASPATANLSLFLCPQLVPLLGTMMESSGSCHLALGLSHSIRHGASPGRRVRIWKMFTEIEM